MFYQFDLTEFSTLIVIIIIIIFIILFPFIQDGALGMAQKRGKWSIKNELRKKKIQSIFSNSQQKKKKAFLVIKDCKGWIEGGGSHKSTTVDGG